MQHITKVDQSLPPLWSDGSIRKQAGAYMGSSFELGVDYKILNSYGVNGHSFFDVAVLVSADHIVKDSVHIFA